MPRLCVELAAQGCGVELLTLSGRVPLAEAGNEDAGNRLGFLALKEVVSIAAKNAQIVHSHSLWRMSNVFGGWAGQQFRRPHVVSPRGTLSAEALQHHRYRKALFSALLQGRTLTRASAFHATSHGEYQDIRRAGFDQPVFVVRNGVDIPSVLVQKPRDGQRILLYVGRVHPIKGLELALEGWQELTNAYSDWVFRIVGPIDSDYARRLRESALSDHIPRLEFVGELSGKELAAEYQTADALILPSLSENFGMVVAEALANGTPVLTTEATPWEALRERDCGWWVSRQQDPFFAAMRDVLSTEREELSRRGMKGRQWMIDEFSWKQVANDMLAAYLWLLGDGARPAFVRD